MSVYRTNKQTDPIKGSEQATPNGELGIYLNSRTGYFYFLFKFSDQFPRKSRLRFFSDSISFMTYDMIFVMHDEIR